MTGRNDPCPCGSGKRYKHCHGADASPGADALARQGIAAHQRSDLATAERLYQEALAAAPEHPFALHYLGVVLYQQGRIADALPLLDRAAELVPAEPEFHNNRGLALAAAERDADAIAAYRRTLDLMPSHAGAWSNLGMALQATGDVQGAVEAFQRGLDIAPDLPQLHWNLALALLLLGRFDEGWREYEWRLRAPELAARLRPFDGPRWAGQDPAGKTILLTAEQGLGDAIQFLRFATRLADRGARVIAAVPPALRTLAATAPGVSEARAIDEPQAPYDFHLPLLSLPHALGITTDSVAVTLPYLRPDPARLCEASAAVAGSMLNVGIAWAGAPDNTNDARRSTRLAALAPLFDVAGVRLFSLKREGEALTPADAPWSGRLETTSLRNDFDGLAALVATLDLVISVDTSLVHLAGALGKPVWVLVPFGPDWRWQLGRTDSPWYPTVRLFRQPVAGDWSQPVRSAAAALEELVQRGDR
jgi:Flp pilus assembly protein TadD